MTSLTDTNEDYAVWLPSISNFYNNIITRYHHQGDDYFPPERIPVGLEHGLAGCNFLKEDDSYFQYKWGLYSIGHAQRDVTKTDKRDMIIQQRDRSKTFILGDSGGYQIVTGVIKCDWNNFKSDDSLRHQVLNWLEHTADYSMILDVPTLATLPQYSAKSGIKDFAQCLDYTKFNADFFVKNRKFETKYLNVMQGMNEQESRAWYDAVKHYPFEGWAFSGACKSNKIDILLRRLIQMRDDKLLERGERDLVHVLGVGKLELAVVYTAIKRALREHVNPDMEFTFDAASPFIGASKGEIYAESIYKSDSFRLQTDRFINDKSLKGSTVRLPYRSPIADRLTMGDMCYQGVGALDKNGQVSKTSWDSLTYMLMQGHNTYSHIESIQRANRFADSTMPLIDTDHNLWSQVSGKGKARQIDDHIPVEVVYMINFIEKLFKSENPMTMINEAESLFATFSRQKSVKNSDVLFTNLFQMGNDETVDSDEEIEQDTSEEFLETLT